MEGDGEIRRERRRERERERGERQGDRREGGREGGRGRVGEEEREGEESNVYSRGLT